MSEFNLDGKVALITGGSRGLGMALSRTLVERDVSVVIVARDGEALNRAVKGLQGKGDGKIEGQVADVTVTEDVERAVAYTVERFGRLDLLINCAGRSTRGRILDTPPDVFQALWDLNFLGTVRCTQACAPHLLQSQGHLVNIGSLASRAVSRYLGAYPATKSALAAYTQQLRLELGPKGVHVLLVCPGPIDRDDAGQWRLLCAGLGRLHAIHPTRRRGAGL